MLLLKLSTAIIVSVIWGLSVLSILSFTLAREQKASPWKVITEHLVIALVVIATTYYVGDWIAKIFS